MDQFSVVPLRIYCGLVMLTASNNFLIMQVVRLLWAATLTRALYNKKPHKSQQPNYECSFFLFVDWTEEVVTSTYLKKMRGRVLNKILYLKLTIVCLQGWSSCFGSSPKRQHSRAIVFMENICMQSEEFKLCMREKKKERKSI